MPSAGGTAVSLQLEPGLGWALAWARHLCTPHWHPLGHQCGFKPLYPSPTWGRAPCVVEVRPLTALPCLLWAGHKALLRDLPSVVVNSGAPYCPHLPHHPNPKGLLVSARTAELRARWGNW